MEMENAEKSVNLTENEINNELKTLDNIEGEFKQYLHQKQKQKQNSHNDYDAKNIVEKSKKNVGSLVFKNTIQEINILDNIPINVLMNEISTYFKQHFEIKKITRESNRDHTHERQKQQQVRISPNIEAAGAMRRGSRDNQNEIKCSNCTFQQPKTNARCQV